VTPVGRSEVDLAISGSGAMKFSALVYSLVFSASVLAHGGGLDRSGCHHDRKVGDYHCHRGELTDGHRSPPDAAYNREDYLPRWADADRDCQNTRQEVLITESHVAVTLDNRGCRVISGQWHDPYTGRVFTDPRKLDIDHLVPLKEAHDSGAASWSQPRKRAYANDLSYPEALIAVYNGANRAKGPRDPASWLPPNTAYLTPIDLISLVGVACVVFTKSSKSHRNNSPARA